MMLEASRRSKKYRDIYDSLDHNGDEHDPYLAKLDMSEWLLHKDHQIHVPYIEQVDFAEKIPDHNVATIINYKHRVYLPPKEIPDYFSELSNKSRFNNISDENRYRRSSLTRGVLDITNENDITSYDNGGLDLGLGPLHRIIEEIRRLSSEAKSRKFDPKAARTAGMEAYTDYLVGSLPQPPKRKTLAEQNSKLSKQLALRRAKKRIDKDRSFEHNVYRYTKK